MTQNLTAVRQEVNNLDSSVVVQELELAMNLNIWSFEKLSKPIHRRKFAWHSLIFTANL